MEQLNLKKEYFDKGMQFINYSKKQEWQQCVNARFDDIYKGEDLKLAYRIMEGLENGSEFEKLKEILDNANLSGASYFIVLKSVLRFSNQGVEFAKFLEPELTKEQLNAIYLKNLADTNEFEKNIANSVAKELHDNWRKTRLKEDGSYEPRWKKINDNKYIEKLDKNNLPSNVKLTDKGYEIDIANSSYIQLSLHWKKENYEAARVVAVLVINELKRENQHEEKLTKLEIGREIHNEWLKRNQWAKDDPILSLPFDKLPKEEQEKDLQQYRLAKEICMQLKKNQTQEFIL